MNVILVSHPSRGEWVDKLQRSLPVVSTVFDTVSARNGHWTALQIASAHRERVIIMEDDAIPVEGFVEQSNAWCSQYPDALISFYLGTCYPREFRTGVDSALLSAAHHGQSSIWMPTLLHGVCYSIPAAQVQRVLDRYEKLTQVKQADYAVGAAWGSRVLYPIESLVQHRDTGSVERHPDGRQRTDQRVARYLAGPLMFNPT